MQKSKYLAVLLSICLLLSLTTVAFAATFTDLQGHWAEGQINQWAAKGLAGGYADGTFKPNNEVSRAEFVALVNRAFALNNGGAANSFTDVKEGQWYYGEVAVAKAAGYIGGYSDGTFRPNQAISRQEAANILTRLLKLQTTSAGIESFADASQIQAWAQGGIGAVVNSGLMRGFPDNTFRPLKSITRAEAVVSLDRALNANGKEVNVKSGIEGKVSLNGKGIANAIVKVFQADSFKVMEETKTDSNGNYKFNLPKGKYDLTASTESEVGYKSDVNVLDNQLTSQALALEKAAILSGDLEDKDGRTVKNATIAFSTNPTFVTTTDKDGKFKVAVLANRDYTVRAYNPDEKDQAPDVVIEGLKVAAAGKQQIATLKAHFAVKSSSGGGGSGGGPSTPDVDVINKPGTHTGDYTINASGTYGPATGTSTIVGSLTINPGSNGEVTIQNIDVDNVTVSSGASNSIRFKGVKVKQTLTIKAKNQNNSVRIVTEGNTDIKVTKVQSKVILEAAQGGSFGDVAVEAAESNEQIEFKGTFNGTITVAPEAQGVVLNLAAGTTLANLDLNSNVTLSGNIQGISNVTVADGVDIPEGNPELEQLAADLEAVRTVKTGLEITFASGENKDNVTQNLTLPTAVSGTNISWSSTNTDVITNNGTVKRPRVGDSMVTLTASIKKGKATVIKTFTVKVKGVDLVPSEPTLEALLNSIQAGLDSLTQEEWNNLKAQRDQLVDSLTEEEVFEALKKSGFENIINTDITIEEARFALGTIRGLAHLGKDNVAESVSLISGEIDSLKTEFSDVVTKLRKYNINQEVVYQYAIDLYANIINKVYPVSGNTYEKDLYNAALGELRNGQHPELKEVAETAFNRLKEHYAADSSIGGILDGIVFESSKTDDVELDATIIMLAKKELESRNDSDYDSLLETLDFMVNLSKTFMPLN